MQIPTTLRFGVVVLGCAALGFAMSGCATCSRGENSASNTIAPAINDSLTPAPGFSLSEDQVLTERDRLVYESTRHGGNNPQNTSTNGTYAEASAGGGQLWHWGT